MYLRKNRFLIWFFWVLVLLVIFSLFEQAKKAKMQVIDLTTFMNQVKNGIIKNVRIIESEAKLIGKKKDGEVVYTYFPYSIGDEIIRELQGNNVNITVVPPDNGGSWTKILIEWLPFILVIVIWLLILNKSNPGKALDFGKSKGEVLTPDKVKVTFDDIAGYEEVKEEVKEIIEFLKDPDKFRRLGARVPKGVLFVGPPGTGKTLFAKAIAGEAGVFFIAASGSEFVEMFVGVGAARIRDLFSKAKEKAPCIIFIDEIDAVGRQRGSGLGGGHDEREQTLNQLLIEMDGFSANDNIIVIAATNRPDILDPALLRPGRFDRKVTIPLPNLAEREAILRLHASKIKLKPGVDLKFLARATSGMSGADLENIVNEAAILAAREGKEFVDRENLQMAFEKVVAGAAKKMRSLDDKEREVLAYHETGHAVAGAFLAPHKLIHKVTIIPRGYAGGITFLLPKKEEFLKTRNELLAEIKVLLAGRAAEEVFLGDITTGAENDLKRATELAYNMVTRWGMTELGVRSFGKREEYVFLGREIGMSKDYSDVTAAKIDEKVTSIIDECYEEVKELLSSKKEEIKIIVEKLKEEEELEGEEVLKILGLEVEEMVYEEKVEGNENGEVEEELMTNDETLEIVNAADNELKEKVEDDSAEKAEGA